MLDSEMSVDRENCLDLELAIEKPTSVNTEAKLVVNPCKGMPTSCVANQEKKDAIQPS
jgi:hypothetical protein